VHITGVALGLARWDGAENARAVTYLVPTYRFHGRIADGAQYDVEVLALDPSGFALVAPPSTGDGVEPQPAPAPEPVPAPAPDAIATAVAW
jgi:hypothetical protein